MSKPDAKPYSPGQERLMNLLMKPVSHFNNWIYRVSGGGIGGRFPGGAPVLLLTTIGRKSGQPRTAPLLYLRDEDNEDRVVVVASMGGMSRHPIWYLNLEANPEVEVEIGRECSKMLARRATPEEKARLWPRLVDLYGSYETYQARTERDIPVVILTPR